MDEKVRKKKDLRERILNGIRNDEKVCEVIILDW